jgi:hypothetical protein
MGSCNENYEHSVWIYACLRKGDGTSIGVLIILYTHQGSDRNQEVGCI